MAPCAVERSRNDNAHLGVWATGERGRVLTSGAAVDGPAPRDARAGRTQTPGGVTSVHGTVRRPATQRTGPLDRFAPEPRHLLGAVRRDSARGGPRTLRSSCGPTQPPPGGPGRRGRQG